MEYAPIIIGTLCRYEHFRRAIESLENNEWAKFTNIYIGVDYPTKDSHLEGYNKIVEFLTNTELKFKNSKIFFRKVNLGVQKNYDEMRKAAFKECGKIIMTEDDNVFSPNFIEYVDTMLEKYEDNKNVIGICGYSYPIEWDDNNSGYVLNNNFFSAWGWGIWENKWKLLQNSINQDFFNTVINKKKLYKIKKESPKSFFYYTRIFGKNNISANDVTISIYMVVNNLYILMPKLSMVRNCGWDGSGLHCDGSLTYDPMNQKIDGAKYIRQPELDKICCKESNMKKLNALFPVEKKDMFISNVVSLLLRILKPSVYCKIRSFIKNREI